jgi:O-antigen ligase
MRGRVPPGLVRPWAGWSDVPGGPSTSTVDTAAAVALGCGAAVTLAGAASGAPGLAIAGGALTAVALMLLIAEEYLDPFVTLALSLPLPAFYAAGDLRLPPALPVTALVVGAWLMEWGPGGRRIRRERLPVAAMTALAAAYLMAALASPHRAAAARELANLALLAALLVAAIDLLARRPERARPAALAVAAVAGVTGAMAALEALGILPGAFDDGGVRRAALGFGQPNGLGMFLALSLPFGVHAGRAAAGRGSRVLAALALACIGAGLLVTFSRGSWLSVLVGTGVLLLVGERRLVLRVWAVALLAALAGDLATGGAVRETAAGVLRDWSVAQRAALMLAGIHLFLDQPVLGAGPGGFAEELDRIGALVPQLWDLKATPHNAYIQVAAESGLVGLSALVFLLLTSLRRAVRAARTAVSAHADLARTALWVLGIACVEGLVEWPLSHGHGQLVVLAAALAFALPVDARPEGDHG